MKQVNNQNLWTFELGTQEEINNPIWIYVVFQQMDRQQDQNLKNDTFHRRSVTSAQYIIGFEKYPDSCILFNFDDDDYSQGYGQIKEAFKALTQGDILQPHISEHDFDRPMMILIMVRIYTFSMYDIKKNLKVLNQNSRI